MEKHAHTQTKQEQKPNHFSNIGHLQVSPKRQWLETFGTKLNSNILKIVSINGINQAVVPRILVDDNEIDGKFWKRWEYHTTWPASWEICMQVKKQHLELDMEQQTGSNWERSTLRLCTVTLLI